MVAVRGLKEETWNGKVVLGSRVTGVRYLGVWTAFVCSAIRSFEG